MKKVLVFSFLCVLVSSATAQTVVWQMRPTDYTEITLINTNLYKVVKNGKIGLINSDGTVVSAENDNISKFYEGKALVTVNDGHGERVSGCLTDDGKYYRYNKKYYTLNGQKFFSDGVLSVSNEQGYLGYIDESGTEVCGFDNKYDRIKPFAEGYAAVFRNKKYYLIDKDGIPVQFMFNSVGDVYGGTNVFKGLVYIWDKGARFYTYDVNKKDPCKDVKSPRNTTMDYLYRFSSVTGLNKEIPFRENKYNARKGLIPFKSGGVYGYTNEDKIILPCQFQTASQFEDGYAVVGFNGRLGIIRIIEGSNFSVYEMSKNIHFYAKKPVSVSFTVEIPAIWRNRDLQIILRDESGALIDVKNTGNNYTFVQTLSATCKKEYSICIKGEGLNLYEGKISYSFAKKEVCPICGKDKDKCGGHEPKKVIKPTNTCPTCYLPISKCPYQGVH